jgi:anti-anti-sigma factor
MQIREEKDGDRLTIFLQGHLDTVTAPSFEARILALIEEGAERVIVDCSEVDYVNSAGLKSFLLAAKRLDAKQGKFVICGLKPNVMMIFETIGFDRIMTISPTREEANRLVDGEATTA